MARRSRAGLPPFRKRGRPQALSRSPPLLRCLRGSHRKRFMSSARTGIECVLGAEGSFLGAEPGSEPLTSSAPTGMLYVLGADQSLSRANVGLEAVSGS